MNTHTHTRAGVPDEDDNGGSLGHGSDQTAGTYDTQEDKENLLAAWHGTLSWNGRG